MPTAREPRRQCMPVTLTGSTMWSTSGQNNTYSTPRYDIIWGQSSYDTSTGEALYTFMWVIGGDGTPALPRTTMRNVPDVALASSAESAYAAEWTSSRRAF